jgi:hypothetical protein
MPLAAAMRADHTEVDDDLENRGRGATAPASTTHCGRKQQRGTEDRFRDSSLAVRRHLHCVHLEHLGHEVEYPGLRGIYASKRVLGARLLTIGVEAELCSAQPWLLHRPSGQPRRRARQLARSECRSGGDGPNCDLCLFAASKRNVMAKLPLVAKESPDARQRIVKAIACASAHRCSRWDRRESATSPARPAILGTAGVGKRPGSTRSDHPHVIQRSARLVERSTAELVA